MYTSNRVRASINEELTKSEFEESLWCNVELDRQRLLVGLCYRCPTSTTTNDDNLLHLMEKAVLRMRPDHLLIMGDFNYPEINYTDETVTASVNDSSSLFFNKTQELCLLQHVTEFTRVRQHQAPSTLDYVFTDEENLIDSIAYEPPLAKSDHVVLKWNMLLAVQDIRSTQVKYNYHKANFGDIQTSLHLVNWDDRWTGKSVNEMWIDFTQILGEQVQLHVPLKNERRKKGPKFSRQIRKMIRERSKAWHKYRQNSSGRNFEKYKRIRNEVNRCIRSEEEQKRKRILKGFKDNPKRFYGYMRQMQSVKDNVIALKKENGELTKTDQETADLLSSYFKEVFTVEDTTNMLTVTERVFNWEDTHLNFSTEIVMKRLQHLKTDKSSGPDSIHPLLLKECAAVLAKPLSLIFQHSYDTRILPDDWRIVL